MRKLTTMIVMALAMITASANASSQDEDEAQYQQWAMTHPAEAQAVHARYQHYVATHPDAAQEPLGELAFSMGALARYNADHPSEVQAATKTAPAGNAAGTAVAGTAFLLFLAFAVGAYFLPTVIAGCRKKAEGHGGILIVNLLLGWTVIGWFVAFIWACTGRTVTDLQREERQHRELLDAVACGKELS
jgi:hypothetical protein